MVNPRTESYADPSTISTGVNSLQEKPAIFKFTFSLLPPYVSIPIREKDIQLVIEFWAY